MDSDPTKSPLYRIPLYRQVADAIRGGYVDGKGAGVRLPSERNLAEVFGVSMATIRSALDVLEKSGSIERLLGSGSYTLGEQKKEVRHVAVLMEMDIASKQLSPFYPHLFQEVRLALHRLNIPSRSYLGYLKVGVEIGELTCREFLDDVRLGRISGVVSVQSRKHNSWVSELRKRGIPVVGSVYSANHVVEVDFKAILQRLFEVLRSRQRKHLAFACLNNGYNHVRQEMVQQAALDYGFELSVFKFPIRTKAQDLEAFRQAWKVKASQPDCLFIGDDMIFPQLQDILNEQGAGHLTADDCYVFGSDSVLLSFVRPFTHCTYSTRKKALQMAESIEGLMQQKTLPGFITVPFSFISKGGEKDAEAMKDCDDEALADPSPELLLTH